MVDVITDNLDLWSTAMLNKSTAGRGTSDKQTAYGIKKLRELILELAVRGKLVPQDQVDQSASELLESCANEKSRLIKEGKIKKQKELPPVSEDELPFVLPENWKVARLGSISNLITKGTTPTTLGYAFTDEGVLFVKVENIESGRIQRTSISQFIDDQTNQALERSQLQAGDVLFSIAGTIGKTCIVYENDLPANTNQALAIIRGTSLVFEPRYLLIQLDSFVAEATRAKARGGAMPNVSLGDLTILVLPIPPIEEQRRIVDKVDELMALCDQLEQQQTDSIAAHQTLVQTLLETLTQATDTAEFEQAWSRIADHFDALFTTETCVDQLKQTLLQLAVMGKLVPQDPNDEPANDLLKSVATEKAKLVNEGKIKADKPLPPIDGADKPFELPKGWLWERLPNISFFQEGPGIMAKDFRDTGVPLIRISGMHGPVVSLDGCNYLDEDMIAKKWNHFRLDQGDIILSSSASLGKVSKVGVDAIGSIAYTGLIRFKPFKFIFHEYLIRFLGSNEFVRQIDDSKRGAAILHFGPTHLRGMIVPVPPFAEQHRIVAKVDELMALCDALKARIATAQTTQLQLADAIVEQAIA